jgi:hypothetical protein
MSRKLRALGLTVLALCGLTALMATSAQANWLENGVEVKENKNVVAAAHTPGTLVVASLNLEIKCTTLASEGLKIVASSATAEGKVAFSGCTAFSKGVEASKCTPENQPIKAGGLALVKLLALKEGGTLLNVVLFEQKGTEPFTTVKLPATCSLAETSNVTGSLVAECGILEPVNTFVQEDCSTSRATHLLQAPTQTIWFQGKEDKEKVEDKLKFGANAATLLGIASATLASGNPWAGEI